MGATMEAAGICKTYRHKTVLGNATFTLAPGCCLGIAGHNGSGKSTLLSIVAQVLPPDKGDLLFEGKSIINNRKFMRQYVGYVPQKNGLLPDLSVDETLRFWQKAYGLDKGALYRPSGVPVMLGLDEIQKQKVGKLSGGMQKRLSIAVALLHQPRFLLMDESFAAIDRAYKQALTAYLIAHCQHGGSILMSSHELDEILTLCHQILVLQQGKIVFWDVKERFPQDPRVLDTLLNPPRINTARQIQK